MEITKFASDLPYPTIEVKANLAQSKLLISARRLSHNGSSHILERKYGKLHSGPEKVFTAEYRGGGKRYYELRAHYTQFRRRMH